MAGAGHDAVGGRRIRPGPGARAGVGPGPVAAARPGRSGAAAGRRRSQRRRSCQHPGPSRGHRPCAGASRPETPSRAIRCNGIACSNDVCIVTGDDHNTDALIAALRSPALPAERAGEAAAVTAMLGALARTPASTRFRASRGIAIAAVTVASLGVGGLAAAGPGVFQAAAGKARSLVTSDSTNDNERDNGAVNGNDPPGGSSPDNTPGLGANGCVADQQAVTTDPVTGLPTAPPPECATGNHGNTVSSVANASLPPTAEDDHSDAVTPVAHDNCTPNGPQGNGTPGGTNPNKPEN